MRVVNLLAVAALGGTLATASAASAQGAGAVHLATVDRTAGAYVPLDERALDARMASADRALKRGGVARAKTIYETLVAELRAANRLPAEPVWRLAAIAYGEGSPRKAAEMLDALAVEAGAAGEVAVEVMALFEAAHIYAIEGMSEESASRLDRGARLLGASELPVETRVALLKKVRA